jgi:hypothetical protein
VREKRVKKPKTAEEVPFDKKLVNRLPVKPPKDPDLKLKNYQLVIEKLDGCVEQAMDTIIGLLDDKDPYVRLRSAELIIKKYLPDKKIKEITGPEGGPVQINIDKREAILQVVGQLDRIGYEELRESARDGNFNLLRPDSGGEGET